MSNLIVVNGIPKSYCKDCCDFVPLKDGTLTGDAKYCDRSLECRQTDAYGVGYVSHWYHFFNHETNEDSFDYFCTGLYGERDERKEDLGVS